MSPLRPLAVTALLASLLAACSLLPDTERSEPAAESRSRLVIPAEVTGRWWVEAAIPSGVAGSGAARLLGQSLEIDEGMARGLAGRGCDKARLAVVEVELRDWYGYRPAAMGLDLPEGRRPLLTVSCGGAPFESYLLREDGNLLARYGGHYFLLTRKEPAMAAEPMPAPAAAAKPKPAPKPLPPRALHLSSEIDEIAATATWRQLKARWPALSQFAMKLQAVDIPGKGPFVRLYAVGEGGLAKRVCATLKKGGQYCAVMIPPK